MKLRIRQEDLHIHGHAIELRVYAEDVPAGFLPSTGTLGIHVAPEGPGIQSMPVWSKATKSSTTTR